ncbi:MAG: 3-oxoacyl-[acyl-carrier-protein] reductase [Bacteroidales bacterium]|nr:3-oxoacyl-[acyl-carrier-protein] reductase [Bacteroidales bacterium]
MGILEGKTVLLTGGTGDIGRAIALLLASEGADIALTCTHTNAGTAGFLESLKSFGHRVECIVSDASDFKSAHDVVDGTVREFGRLDILVNNAGIVRDNLILRMSEEDFDTVINVNLKSVFNYTHAAAPHMVRARSGSIINITSIVGESGNAGQCNYAASKAGIIGFSKSIAKELATRNIRCNCVAPGFIESRMTEHLPEAVREHWLKNIPSHKGGSVEDVAGTVLFLASDRSSYINGQVIDCCGGLNC